MPNQEAILQALRDMTQKMDRHHEANDHRLTAIEKVQIKQEANLEEHMRRTALLEEGQLSLKAELEPIKKHVAFIEAGFKWIGIVSLAVSIMAGISKIAYYIFSIFSK